MKIAVAVRARLWGFEVAHQLQKHALLSRLYTSYWGRFMGRDNRKGFDIPDARVSTNHYSAFRTYMLPDHDPLQAERYFGRWVAAQMTDEDAIITWGLQAKSIIEQARKKEVKVILERGSSHVLYQRDILMEEHRLHGASLAHLQQSFTEERVQQEMWEYEHANLVVVPSQFVKRTFLLHGFDEKKIFVNNFGADLGIFKPQEKQDEVFRVIYTGQLTLRKGIQYLLQAFHELDLSRAELWLVGRISDEIRPFMTKYGRDVKYFPAVPQVELVSYYRQCDAFAICSVEEGLAMVQLQAMACGLPLICTTNTGGEDLVSEGHDGFVLPPRDVERLKEKISYLYHKRDICREMGKMARAKVLSGRSWDDYGDRMVEKYKQICSNNRKFKL